MLFRGCFEWSYFRVSYQSMLDIFIAQVTYVHVEWLENSDKQTEKEGKKKTTTYALYKSPSREARMWRTSNVLEEGI